MKTLAQLKKKKRKRLSLAKHEKYWAPAVKVTVRAKAPPAPKGTAEMSKKRLARLREGYPLSTGRTPKKPPRTRRKKGEWEVPGKGRYS